MTDEYQIDNTTWAEKDSNGNLVIKNLRNANFDGNLIIESDGAGNVDLKNLNSVTADVLNNVHYFPPERIDSTVELSTTSPATSYTSLSLSAPPSDASIALLNVAQKGDGSSTVQSIACREAGTTRARDDKAAAWAGHGSFNIDAIIQVPMDANNEIEYVTQSSADTRIRTVGYL